MKEERVHTAERLPVQADRFRVIVTKEIVETLLVKNLNCHETVKKINLNLNLSRKSNSVMDEADYPTILADFYLS